MITVTIPAIVLYPAVFGAVFVAVLWLGDTWIERAPDAWHP